MTPAQYHLAEISDSIVSESPLSELSVPDWRASERKSTTVKRLPFMSEGSCPLIFSADYDLRLQLTGPTKTLPYDFNRRGRAFSICQQILGLRSDQFYSPHAATEEELLLVHSTQHLQTIKDPGLVARVLGIPELKFKTPEFIEERVLAPLRLAVGGSITGVELALTNGWAFNFSGGFHHAVAERAEGLCFYADTAIAVRKIWKTHPQLNVLIVDLDAHGMNGPWELLGHDPRVTMFDIYNSRLYPALQLNEARPYPEPPAGIAAKCHDQFSRFLFPVGSQISDNEYLAILWQELPKAIKQLPEPAMIVYHAGQDPFQGDRLGRMQLSENGILGRDAFVFEQAVKNELPILTLLSGGYSRHAANLIAKSLLNILHLYTDAPLQADS